MAILSRFLDLPVIRRIAKVYADEIGSNQSNITVKGTPAARGESHPIVGSADPSPLFHELNSGYIRPNELACKFIRLDLAVARNPEVKTALKNLAYDAAGSFQAIKVISAVNKEETQKIVNDFVKVTKFKTYLSEYFRRGLHYGNEYLQHEVQRIDNNKARIKQLFYMPPYGMIRCSNELDQFLDKSQAFEQHDVATGIHKGKKAIGVLPEWAINHIRMFSLPGEPYGFSLLEGMLASGSNDRLVDLFMEMYLQRKYSTVTDVHQLSGPEGRAPHPDLLEAHESKVAKLKRALFGKAPAKDIVMPNGTITRLQSDANTDKTKDVELQASINLAETHQSRQMLTDDQFANVGVLVEKYRQFYTRQEGHLGMFLQQIDESVQFDLALHGIDPADVELEYQVNQTYLFQDLVTVNKEAREDNKAGKLSDETKIKIGSMLYRVTVENEQERIKKEQEAKRISDQNNSDETKKLVDKAINNKDIEPRDVTIKEVDPEEIESEQIN